MHREGARWLSLLLAAGMLACAAPGSRTPAPSGIVSRSTPTSTAAVACDRLEARAPTIEACPLAGLPVARPAVAYGQDVTEEAAHQMAEGFARSYAIANWAINAGYTRFLQAGLVSSPQARATAISFGEDLAYLARARQRGVTYRVDQPLQAVLVRPATLAPEVRSEATREQFVSGPVALVIDFRGPYSARLGDEVVASYPAGYAVRVLLFGELRNDSDLGGWIWSWGGYTGCGQPWVGGTCRG
jgi:hypothetical protein